MSKRASTARALASMIFGSVVISGNLPVLTRVKKDRVRTVGVSEVAGKCHLAAL
jgi:hypothetical protein